MLRHTYKVHTKFHKDWFRHSKVDKGGYTHRQHGDLMSLLSYFQTKESRVKMFLPEVSIKQFRNYIRLEDKYLNN
jgi:hypothetical protein